MTGVKVTKHVPKPEPVRVTVQFSREKLIEALTWWCAAQGIDLPDGKAYVYGLDTMYRDESESLTLVREERQHE